MVKEEFKMSNLSKISVAILAGGFGTRLQSVVNDKPKVLADVNNHPFLEYLLNQLNSAHFKKIVLCTGYLHQQVKKTFGEKYKDINLLYSIEQKPLGTAGSLRKTLPLLDSETILVMNGDSFCEIDFEKFWEFHIRKNSNVTIALTSVSDANRYGTVNISSDDSITRFQEKKQGHKKGFINAGIYLIKKKFIKQIPKHKEISIERDIFPTWIVDGFYGYKASNNFIDIGTPQSYERAEEFFANYTV